MAKVLREGYTTKFKEEAARLVDDALEMAEQTEV